MTGAPERECGLCGLPAGGRPLERNLGGRDLAFCCLGCLNVYTILLESGMVAEGSDFRSSPIYQESLRLGLISNRQAAKPAIPEGAEMREAVYHLSGMWCASCGWLIEHALLGEPGVATAEVMFASDLVRVRYCPQMMPPSRIPERVASLGYRAGEYTGQTDTDRRERRDLLLRIGVAAFLWMNVMTLSLVIYASYWEAISDAARHIIPAVLMALTAPAVFYSAWPILRVAFLGLRRATLRMEALLSLGILAAYFYSSAQAFLGGKHYYFDTACAIVTLVLLGKLLERGAKERTTAAIALLYRMMPSKARLIGPGGGERFVAIEALAAGGEFLVKAGERIPADGTVVSGESYLDESVLTGESTPVARRPGDPVTGGSLNSGGVLTVRATRVGRDSTLARIIRGVEAAMSGRAPIERVVDRVSRVFVPVVIALAIITLAAGLAARLPAAEALMRAIAVLVIACPCALGIATPLALTAAVGSASRRGILVRDSRVLEQIEKIDLLILDKTGTVTTGDFSLTGFYPPSLDLAPIAALENYSEHPLGRAVVRAAAGPLLEASNVEIHKGMGISGMVAGVPVVVGTRRHVGKASACQDCESWARNEETRGATVAFVAIDGRPAGALSFGDSIRPGAAELVDQMRRRGVSTVVLSGDARETTAAVAREISAAEFIAEALPEDKLDYVRRRKAAGAVVAMAGDGVNDAPALAAADLGIALGSGADIAMEAAPVVLMTPALGRIAEVFDLSRATLRIVRQNLFWAFFYNAAGIALAATGVLNPILAAGAMVLSSLSVIGNSMRLRRGA